MRTTLTIEDNLLRELKDQAHHRGLSLKTMVQDALSAGLRCIERPAAARKYRCRSFSLGEPLQGNLDKALAIASALDDEAALHDLALRK